MISFGTDGWRAVIADGFTFDNVRCVTGAVAVAARGLQPPPDVDRNALVVGYEGPGWVPGLSAAHPDRSLIVGSIVVRNARDGLIG